MNYISRQGNIELVDSDYNLYSNKDEIKDACKNFNSVYKIPTQNEIINFRQKEKRETYNIVFSMKEHSLAPVNKIRIAAINTIKKKYPDNYFVIAMHNDTDNPHCHLCLKSVNKNGKRVNIKKADLNELRKNFAIELRKLNIEATATIRKNKY
nr:relaxase/mobilization nuclease domain-containing protein [Campylobacter blaseri]